MLLFSLYGNPSMSYLLYGITQYYLPPDISECGPAGWYNLPAPEGWKAELTSSSQT